ncbi:hypothetical protein AMATHDRAFT_45016 [Amanita thiersii Skay4041]|uniref:Uncharacterized protein n=1 Tax=Amanita thiersii Skay4041 TaxID=703135 RepID=A0A2A9NZD0_9AGAR|nr:hypothetical protein AMATHDRAFT_45016 [Amanita thiersii Skay4041]
MVHPTYSRKRTLSEQHGITFDLRKTTTTGLTKTTLSDVPYASVPVESAKFTLENVFRDNHSSCDILDTRKPTSIAEADYEHVHTGITSAIQNPSMQLTRTISSPYPGFSSPTEIKPESTLKNDLIEIEGTSRFMKQQFFCSTCNKSGVNFPKCGKCDKAWCSRECRLKTGKRHICLP